MYYYAMYYEEHIDYIRQYKNNIRKISYRTHRPKLTKSLDLEFTNHSKSYDLHFSKSGILTNSYFYRYIKNKITQIILNTYSYDKNNNINFILSVNAITNVLDLLVEFEYNEQGKILHEIVTHYSKYDDSFYIQEFYHSYKENYHKVEYNDEGLEEDVQYVSEQWFNEKGDIIERKFWSSEDGIHIWDKYVLDDAGKWKEFDVNEDGSLVERKIDYKWESTLEVSEGFERVTDFRDGEPMWIKEKKIEFY